MKVCLCCKEKKDMKEFGKDSAKGDGLQIYCRRCLSEKNRNRSQQSALARRERNRLYEANKKEYREPPEVMEREILAAVEGLRLYMISIGKDHLRKRK